MKRYIRERLHAIVKLSDPPHRLALAFALGIFIAFSPTIGLHMISCLAIGWLFRLNTLVIITASLVNNPWTMVPLYGFCTWFGLKVTGQHASVPRISWNELTLANSYEVLKPYLWSYVAGTLILGSIAACISYFAFHAAVVHYRRITQPE